MEKRTKGRSGGSKLNRSETVTMRLDPRLRYLIELAARQHRRTVSSFIEWTLERTLDSIILDEERDDDGRLIRISLADEAFTLWDTDEPDRIVKLALHYPELLTHDEQVVWKLIKECGYLWRGSYNEQGHWTWEIEQENLIFERLREHWDTFTQVAAGEIDKSNLPTWIDYKPPSSSEHEGNISPL